MKTRITTHNLVLSLFALVLSTTALTAQNIITIDNNAGSTTTYQTIQDAHDNASPGDIIYVQPSGTSYGNIDIRKPLTIIGRSHSETNKVSQLGTVRQGANNITLRGLSISNFRYDTSSPEPALRENLEITNCKMGTFSLGNGSTRPTDNSVIRGNIISSISISQLNTNVLITNNIITGSITSRDNQSTLFTNNVFRTTSSTFSITSDDPDFPMILANNMFIFNRPSDTSINLGSYTYGFSNNLTYNYGTGNVNFNPGSSTISFTNSNALENTDPLFVNVDSSNFSSLAGLSNYSPENVPDEDLRLQAGSPALTAGSGGSEIGLYSNNYNYNVLGQPTDYPTLDVESYDVAVPKDGNINVTITAKAY